jgi:hypothetical protein
MAQQTAVDWLVQQIGPFLQINKELGKEIVSQAKAMEKEKILQIYNQGYINGTLDERCTWRIHRQR